MITIKCVGISPDLKQICESKDICRRCTEQPTKHQEYREYWKNHENCQHYVSERSK